MKLRIKADHACIITTFILLLTIATALTACGGSGNSSSEKAVSFTGTVAETSHTHTPAGKPVIVKMATCTEDGEEIIVCSECGETISTKTIPATGHTTNGVEWIVSTKATCASNASSSLICPVCGETVETREDEGTQLEHTYGSWTQVKKSTCSVVGEKERTCSVCGYVDVAALSLASHTYGDWTVTTAPTCTTAGVETRTCTVCGSKETQSVAATGHTWKDYGSGIYWKVTIEATCIADGEKICECTVCGHTSTKAIAHDGTEHNVTIWTTTKESSCTTAGMKSGTCTICGKTVTVSLALTDHSYSAWIVTKSPTATSEGTETRTCSVCGTKEVRILECKTIQESTTIDTKPVSYASELIELPVTSYYGYQYLSTLGTAYTNAYTILADSIAAMKDIISVTDCRLTRGQFELVYQCYCDDFPQHFWLSKHIGYSYGEDGIVTTVTPEYSCTVQQKEKMQAKFETAVKEMLTGLNSSMSDFEIECIIHDRLTNGADYDSTFNADWTYTAYGNLVNHISVCEGYARAFQYLMYRCGIETLYISGTGSGIEHAWNMVKLDGEYYHVDVTWDDPITVSDSMENHEYLNCTESYMISSGHTIIADSYPIPSATATTYRYYIRNGYSISSLSVDALTTIVSKEVSDGVSGSFEILLSKAISSSELANFVKANINDLCDGLSTGTGKVVTSLRYIVSESGYVVTLMPVFG